MENKIIYQKLLESQREIGKIKKDSDNPFFHSKYFDINSLLAVIKPVLNDKGLLLTQAVDSMDGKTSLVTVITHAESGEMIKVAMHLPEITDVQKMGGAITYFRRYALQSLLALEAEDDDGNGASDKVTNGNPKVFQPKMKGKTIINKPTPDQVPFGTANDLL